MPVIKTNLFECQGEEFFNGVRFACRDDVIIWLILLQHHPHCTHVVTCVTPVTLCIKVAHDQFFFNTQLDASSSVGNLASHELKSTTWAFMIEQNA
jgi:hypothetical protein